MNLLTVKVSYITSVKNLCTESQFLTVAVIENVAAQILNSSTQKIAEAFCTFDAALDLQKFFKGAFNILHDNIFLTL